MYKPNYSENNIVNLMSSIKKELGVDSDYNSLDIQLEGFSKIVLIVLDGLGYNYLRSKQSFMGNQEVMKLQGAFPLTTAASNTVFSFGTPVQQHGLTGWFVYLKEVGSITTVLPFTERYYGSDLNQLGFSIKDMIQVEPYTKHSNRKTYKIMDESYAYSAFSKVASEGSEIIGAKPLDGTFDTLSQLVQKDESSYIHAYIGNFDSSGHEHGVSSIETEKVFYDLDRRIEQFASECKDTLILITADHGMLDSNGSTICLNDYPEIMDCLSMPLSGDSRIGYCYLRNGMEMNFLKLVNKHLSDKVYLFKSTSMLENNWFGLGEPHPMLKYRIGDYVLLTKDEYILYDNLGNEDRDPVPGHHSGISPDEVYVPLVMIKR